MVSEAISFVKNNYNDNEEYSHGCYCEFMPKCNYWGIKIYTEKKYRDTSFYWQEKAANVGLGPDVGGRFDVKINDKMHYCYLTEIVMPIWDSKLDDNDWELNHKLNRMHHDAMTELREALLDTTGFMFCDRHVGNVGFKNGKMVCIDFGDED